VQKSYMPKCQEPPQTEDRSEKKTTAEIVSSEMAAD